MFKAKFIALSKYITCPNCGAAVSCGVTNGTTRCPKCKKGIRVQNGEPVGWF